MCANLFALLCCISALATLSKAVAVILLLAGFLSLCIYATKTNTFLKKWGGPIAVSIVLASVYVVFFRGCLAETALGERSLLVRSQYFVGGLEIAGTHLLGVGPAGIQDAWLGVRPESATEIIRSTHNIVIDWLTSYGILALCWITILVKLLWNAGKRLSIQDRSDKRQILAAGIGVAAIVLVVDAQIDLIMFDLGSTLFAFCLLGLAGAYTDIRTRRKGIDLCISVVPFVMASVIFYCGYAPLAHDESLQRNAAISMINGDQVAEVASILAEQSVTDQSTLIAVKLYMSVDDKNAATTILKDAIPTSSVWLAWRTLHITKRAGMQIAFVGIGVVMFISSIVVGNRLTEDGPIEWAYYTPEILQESLDAGDTVVLEFTAEWCLNCKLLESTVLHSSRVVEAFESEHVFPIKIDLTGNNVDGNALLHKVGGLRIPLLIILGPNGVEVFRGDFYTVDQVLHAIAISQGAD